MKTAIYTCRSNLASTAVLLIQQFLNQKLELSKNIIYHNSCGKINDYVVSCSGGIYEFHKTSYLLYSFIGCSITINVGLLYSRITSKSFRENARKWTGI
jgi:hypothetical protein